MPTVDKCKRANTVLLMSGGECKDAETRQVRQCRHRAIGLVKSELDESVDVKTASRVRKGQQEVSTRGAGGQRGPLTTVVR